mgnify:CR=1 FL=1
MIYFQIMNYGWYIEQHLINMITWTGCNRPKTSIFCLYNNCFTSEILREINILATFLLGIYKFH